MVLLAIAMISVWLLLRASLPRLNGQIALTGLSAPVTIERDDNGLVTITASGRHDMVRALGYAHAQERFFEMDLARRSATGELAALIGESVVTIDRDHRMHRFRARAQRWWPNLPDADREQLQAYADGVNAGLGDLGVRPWPYLLLSAKPEPWRAEDSMLVVLAMFFDLQDSENRRERQLDVARRHLPDDVLAFVARGGTEWDAPLAGGPVPEPPIPPVSSLDLRTFPAVELAGALLERSDPGFPGSNNFAVAGSLTTHGRALVANDMHLGLGVPNIWFRARLIHGEDAARVDIEGVTLPGVPALVVGSNGHVAWAFTNSYGDWLDLVRLEVDSATDPARYRTADGWRGFDIHEERIDIAGAESETLIVRETLWGPLIAGNDNEPPMALAWTAHREGSVNVRLIDMETARNTAEALAVAAGAGVPAQNFVVGDEHGHIAWTIAGRIPLRSDGHDASRPIDGSTLTSDIWQGWLPADRQPRIIDPPSGRLWTANARVVDGEALRLIGEGGYDNGARAAQIRDGLLARDSFDEKDLLAIQLDDRALFLDRWWRLLRNALASSTQDKGLSELSDAIATWDGCACVDSIAYRLVRTFRTYVHEAVMQALAEPVRAQVPDFTWPKLPQNEGVVWQLLRQRPAHWLPQPFASWDELLVAQARRVAESLADEPGGLRTRTWGEANTVQIRHPLSAALPGFVGAWLDMPAEALPGDAFMPRVQGVRFGASERLVVAPGLESQAIAHMPAGQSGHPLAPYYGAGHADWTTGTRSALRPQQTRWLLKLEPETRRD
jgi:penicillin amidase